MHCSRACQVLEVGSLCPLQERVLPERLRLKLRNRACFVICGQTFVTRLGTIDKTVLRSRCASSSPLFTLRYNKSSWFCPRWNGSSPRGGCHFASFQFRWQPTNSASLTVVQALIGPNSFRLVFGKEYDRRQKKGHYFYTLDDTFGKVQHRVNQNLTLCIDSKGLPDFKIFQNVI